MDSMLLAYSHVESLRSALGSDRHGNGARVVAAAQLEPVNVAGVRPPHVYGLWLWLKNGAPASHWETGSKVTVVVVLQPKDGLR